MSPIRRKAQTGEPTSNGGHFGSRARDESSVSLSGAVAAPLNFRLASNDRPVTAEEALAKWNSETPLDFKTIAAGRHMAEQGKKPSRRQIQSTAAKLRIGLRRHITSDMDSEQVLAALRRGAQETGLDLAKLGRPLPEPTASALPGPRHEVRTGRLVSLTGDNYRDVATPDDPRREVPVAELIKPISQVLDRAQAQGELDPAVRIEILTEMSGQRQQTIAAAIHVPAIARDRFLNENGHYSPHAESVQFTAYAIVESFNRQGKADFTDKAFTTTTAIRFD